MKLNALQLIGSFHQGGSERQAVQLTRLLHEQGHYRVRVASLDGTGLLREEVERLGLGEVPSYPLKSFYDLQMVTQLRRFARFLKEQEIAVVQTHDFYSNVFGMAAAALAGVPVRIAARRETGGVRSAAQKLVERGAYRLAHAVVANCEAVRQQVIAEGTRAEKAVTIYNGLEMERVTLGPDFRRDEALAFFGLPRDGARRFVTIVANLRLPVKDHPTFLRAARRVREVLPEAAFVIAGEGELTEPMRAFAAGLGLAEHAFFIGRCADVARLLAVSDVCVLSSRAEGFSNSILEYMAAARPVVATDVGGAREAVIEGETGYIVPPGDDRAMAERVIALLREPQRARAMGERGRRLVEEKFSCAAQLERTEKLYDRLLARTPSRSPWRAGTVRGELRQTAVQSDEQAGAAPLRVLIVAASLDILGGQAVQAGRLLEGLAAEARVEAELLPVNPRLPGALRQLQRVKYVRTVVTSLLYLGTLLARVPRCDVVHVFSTAYASFLLAPMPAVFIARLFGKPVLLNYHSGEGEDHLRRSPLARAVIRRADHVVVPSGYLVEVFAKFGIQAKAVSNTVDVSRYIFRVRQPLHPTLVSNRNLEPMYNVECTLRAFKLLQQQLPEARLIVAGDGSQRSRLRVLARELELKQVEFLGKIAPTQMPALYDRADVFINASVIDNMPLSIIEAFAAGLPVVTTDAGGIPHIVENGRNGLLARCGDEQSLARAVLRLFNEPGLAVRLATAARADCESYTWAAVRSDWLHLYQELAEVVVEQTSVRSGAATD